MLSQELVDSLFPSELPAPGHWARRYPPRELPSGAEVTRFAPSPTGWLHIGGVFTASVDQDIAHHSGGVYLVRIEDTDQSRFDPEAASQFEAAFDYFGIGPDEGGETGGYGPYAQSERGQIYLTYVRELMRQGKAYPCFETKEQGEARVARQRATGALPGYYGEWAIWRDAGEEEVRERLAVGAPYVVRFRSPGAGGRRVSFTDEIRGEITQDDNRNDVVILKSSNQPLRLPTYHFAHAVDDHLMRVTLVIRGEEWLSSVPLHHQLFDALGFPRIPYAHVAPLMKQDGGSRRKLSKRRDPEASVGYYIEQGIPVEAVQYYLRGLANGRLAEMPLPEALATPLRLSEFGVAGPLLDLVKLDDICADFVSTLPGAEILDRVLPWADGYDPDLASVLRAERDLALRALAVEREGADNPRKDLRRWAEFRPVYGFFFPEIFEPVTDPADPRFCGLDPDLVRAIGSGFADGYQPLDPGPAWFEQVRELSARLGFAPSNKEYKKNPDAYPGSIADVSQVIRVLLTGSRRSPDLGQVCAAIGEPEVLRRARALS
jgi:glutamyl-tRNA synthetase